ncbi:MAG: hypothetical protein ACK4Z9_08580, partial [Thermodesulfovibrionales bacterium]
MKGYFIIIGILIIVVSALITLNIFFQNTLQLDMAEQFNKQQLLLARSIAETIGSYIGFMKEEVSEIAHELSEKDLVRKEDFDSLVKRELRHKGIVMADTGFFNDKGDVRFLLGDSEMVKRYLPDLLMKSNGIEEGESKIIELPSILAIISPVFKN